MTSTGRWINLAALSQSEYLTVTEAILLNLVRHPLAQEPAPAPFPDRQELQAGHDTYRGYFHSSENGDRVQGILRNQAREVSSAQFVHYRNLLLARAGNDLSQMVGSGYERPERQSRNAPATASKSAPTKTRARHGEHPGTIILDCAREGAASLQVQMSDGDPTGEESWGFIEEGTTHFTGIVAKNLVPGRRYFFRFRYIGSNGPGPWSVPISLICM
jgi:hypothetical protein